MDDAEQGDEKLELSGDALAALQEFYSEREDRENRFEDLKASAELQAVKGQLSIEMFTEDWNASQFWAKYSDETATVLAKGLLEGATDNTRIAVISAPSAFVQLKNLTAAKKDAPKICLLEFDGRFAVFEEYVHYDFNDPFKLPVEMKGEYDRVLCDPPFLSSDCQTKAAMTVRWLLKVQSAGTVNPAPRTIVCTGERMEDLIHKLYANTRTTTFEPKHAQNRLSNDFRCYANFECGVWSWR